MRKEDLLWLAGLMEGEGSFMTINHRGKLHREVYPAKYRIYKYPRVALAMIDEDIITRVSKLFNQKYTKVTPKQTLKNGLPKKEVFHFALTGKRAYELMLLLYPYMGTRRKEQIKLATESYTKELEITKLRSKEELRDLIDKRERDKYGKLLKQNTKEHAELEKLKRRSKANDDGVNYDNWC